MEEKIRCRLKDGGIAVDGLLERLMGSEALLEQFLKKFLTDPNYEALCRAWEAGDEAGAVAPAHTLKGMCGNLSMTVLYDLFTRQVAAIRAGDTAQAAAMMEEIASARSAAAAAIAGGSGQ